MIRRFHKWLLIRGNDKGGRRLLWECVRCGNRVETYSHKPYLEDFMRTCKGKK